MKTRLLSVIAIACALTACQSAGTASSSTSTPAQPTVQGNTSGNTVATTTMKPQRFECKNGMTAVVKYLGNDTISLSVDTVGAEVKLSQAVSGSGERYTNSKGFYNKATEWHQKGNLGYLTLNDPYGNLVETSCSAK